MSLEHSHRNPFHTYDHAKMLVCRAKLLSIPISGNLCEVRDVRPLSSADARVDCIRAVASNGKASGGPISAFCSRIVNGTKGFDLAQVVHAFSCGACKERKDYRYLGADDKRPTCTSRH